MHLTTAIKQLHRPARLAALERARVARDQVVYRRQLLRSARYLFSAETRPVEEELGAWKMEWREAPAEMNDAKRGLL
jgi:hypothetical protein